jgi:hypothetical protein
LNRTLPGNQARNQAWFSFLVLSVLLGIGIFTGSLAVTPARADTNYALSFDGNANYINLGTATSLFGSTSWTATKTVSLWVLPDAGAPPAPVNYPPSGEIILNTARPLSFGLTRANYNGLDRLWVWNADSDAVDMLPLNYTPGVWTHIAIVHNAGTLSVYQDGVLVTSTSSGSTAISSGYFYLGGSGSTNPANYFQGQIDEVRFWNTALDQATLSAWMSQEINPSHPNYANLMAYYRMSDGTGTTLTDDAGFGHSGTMLGGMSDASWVPSTAFELPPAPTPTNTPVVPTATPLPPTNTPLPPTSTPTATAVPATATSAPPTSTPTNTSAAPTNTPLPATNTPLPPTNTPAAPTNTPLPPTNTPTNTPLPPTNTPTQTSIPPTPTPTQTAASSGYALQFDGNNDFVELSETSAMLGAGWETSKTVEVWVKPLGDAQQCAHQDVVNCDAIIGDRARWWGIYRGIRLGNDRIWIWNFDGSLDVIPVTYVPGEWVHITLVHANGVLHAYKNGVEVGSMFSGATLQPNTGAQPVLHIGGIVNSGTAYWTFEGLIDEVRFWNTARTTTEVQQDMNHALTGSEPGLKAYYQMSNGNGLVLSDDSQYSWDGTLFDGARGLPPDGSPPEWVVSDAFGSVP